MPPFTKALVIAYDSAARVNFTYRVIRIRCFRCFRRESPVSGRTSASSCLGSLPNGELVLTFFRAHAETGNVNFEGLLRPSYILPHHTSLYDRQGPRPSL